MQKNKTGGVTRELDDGYIDRNKEEDALRCWCLCCVFAQKHHFFYSLRCAAGAARRSGRGTAGAVQRHAPAAGDEGLSRGFAGVFVGKAKRRRLTVTLSMLKDDVGKITGLFVKLKDNAVGI